MAGAAGCFLIGQPSGRAGRAADAHPGAAGSLVLSSGKPYEGVLSCGCILAAPLMPILPMPDPIADRERDEARQNPDQETLELDQS